MRKINQHNTNKQVITMQINGFIDEDERHERCLNNPL